MQKLSVTKFKETCKQIAPASFAFDTDNQSGVNELKNAKITARYPEMVIMLNPNRICFKNKMGILCLNRVKYILYDDDADTAGAVFNIICGNPNNEDNNKTYVIVADKIPK